MNIRTAARIRVAVFTVGMIAGSTAGFWLTRVTGVLQAFASAQQFLATGSPGVVTAIIAGCTLPMAIGWGILAHRVFR